MILVSIEEFLLSICLLLPPRSHKILHPERDIKLMKQYEKLFTVNPPGRAFMERINARVSTW